MNERPKWRTVLCGFGKAGASYADDPLTAGFYRYISHAQVLRDHPRFDWRAVVDLAPENRRAAAERWGVPVTTADPAEVAARIAPEVAVLATPPEARRTIIEALPDLRAVLVEKPLGGNTQEALAFAEYCAKRGLLVEVNLWRRADATFQKLAAGGLTERIGSLQAATGYYGNGIRNNGVHLVDFLRQLCGEVRAVAALGRGMPAPQSSVGNDMQVPATLWFAKGLVATLHPLDFSDYRELGVDLWGSKGRLTILQEGLSIATYHRVPHRAISGGWEVASDRPEAIESTVGTALWRVYDDLAAALDDAAPLVSPAMSAVASERIVEAVVTAARAGTIGTPIVLA